LGPAFGNWIRRKASYMLNTCKSIVVFEEKQEEAHSYRELVSPRK
jgi:hypothetical protein